MTYVNPLDQAQSLRQKLATLISGQGIHPDAASPLQAQQTEDTQSQNRASDYATRLTDTMSGSTDINNSYLQAVQKHAADVEAARQKKLWDAQMAKINAAKATGTPSYAGGTNLGSAFGNVGSGKLAGPYELTSKANTAYNNLAAAYRRAGFGTLSVISGGRTYAEQAKLYQAYLNGTGNLAAKPGTSVHESGRAVDFGGAAHDAGTAAHRWLEQNAGKYGWSWTGKNFKQFEPWHFEYTG